MVLVDSSVLIAFLKGSQNPATAIFDKILAQDISFGISAYTYQEILQGARDEREYKQLQNYLDTQRIYYLPENRETYEKAARIYFDLRRRGITVRASIDVLIALTAMEHKLALLHNDHDFEAIATVVPQLAFISTLH